jgi:two-component system, LytTR family, sensor kinase
VVRKRLYWTIQIGSWLFYALVQIFASFLASGGVSTRRAVFLLYEALIFLVVTHIFRIYVKKKKWITLGPQRLIPLVLVSVFSLGLIVYVSRMPVSFLLGIFEKSVALDLSNILGLTFFYAVILFIWSVLYFTYHYFDQYNKALKYEASMVQIELNNLKSQLNPHFIFNALNSIRALVDENPVKSKQAINQLSTILRSSLASEKKGLTKFDDELKIVKDYLGLESIRFEERLKTEFDIHPESHDFFVPPLMIQTLVENGIKHGISKLTPGGIIQLKTLVDNGRLKIQIRNSGHLMNGVKRSKGIGLKNTVQRLKLIYGDEATFRIVNENDNFVLTEITIPQNKKV